MPSSISMSQDEVIRVIEAFGIDFSVEGAVVGELQFSSFRNPRQAGIYFAQGISNLPAQVRRSLVIVSQFPYAPESHNAYIKVNNPQIIFYKLQRTCTAFEEMRGIHPTAIIHADTQISPDAYIGPFCVVESDVVIGPNSILDSHVVVKSKSKIGARVRIESHSTIGATGAAWVWEPSGDRRVVQPQTGHVEIGDDVFLGSDITVVRGSINEATKIGSGGVIAHGTKIGHGCLIANHVHMANNVSIGGNVDIGDKAFFGSGAVVRARARIAERVVVGAGAVVIKDALEPGDVLAGNPAKSIRRSNSKLSGVPSTNAEG